VAATVPGALDDDADGRHSDPLQLGDGQLARVRHAVDGDRPAVAVVQDRGVRKRQALPDEHERRGGDQAR
jgi:hypothetical protein